MAGKFRVAKPGERAGQPGEDEGINDARPGVLRGGMAGEHENARADDGADAQRREIDRAERAFEAAGRSAPRPATSATGLRRNMFMQDFHSFRAVKWRFPCPQVKQMRRFFERGREIGSIPICSRSAGL